MVLIRGQLYFYMLSNLQANKSRGEHVCVKTTNVSYFDDDLTDNIVFVDLRKSGIHWCNKENANNNNF